MKQIFQVKLTVFWAVFQTLSNVYDEVFLKNNDA